MCHKQENLYLASKTFTSVESVVRKVVPWAQPKQCQNEFESNMIVDIL